MKPYDDENIQSNDRIIRYIDKDQDIVFDKKLEIWKLTKSAFSQSSEPKEDNSESIESLNEIKNTPKVRTEGMSVDVESLINQKFPDTVNYIKTYEKSYDGAVTLVVGEVRKLELLVGLDISEEKPFHGQVWGNNENYKIRTSHQKKLLGIYKWLVPIPDLKLS